jgi:hypothetical protein
VDLSDIKVSCLAKGSKFNKLGRTPSTTSSEESSDELFSITSLSLVLLRINYAVVSPLVDRLPLYRELVSLFLNFGPSEIIDDLPANESNGFDPEKDLSLPMFNSSAKFCPGIIRGFTLEVRIR